MLLRRALKERKSRADRIRDDCACRGHRAKEPAACISHIGGKAKTGVTLIVVREIYVAMRRSNRRRADSAYSPAPQSSKLMFLFAIRIVTGAYPAESFAGLFPRAKYQSGGYAALKKVLKATPPRNTTIFYGEPRRVRYYSERTVIHNQGLTHCVSSTNNTPALRIEPSLTSPALGCSKTSTSRRRVRNGFHKPTILITVPIASMVIRHGRSFESTVSFGRTRYRANG